MKNNKKQINSIRQGYLLGINKVQEEILNYLEDKKGKIAENTYTYDIEPIGMIRFIKNIKES
jgi:hypothetical protein